MSLSLNQPENVHWIFQVLPHGQHHQLGNTRIPSFISVLGYYN